jgi:hypothetical protein
MLYFGTGNPLILDREVDFFSTVTGIQTGYRSSTFRWSCDLQLLSIPGKYLLKKMLDIFYRDGFDQWLDYEKQYSLPHPSIPSCTKDNKSTKIGQIQNEKRADLARFS